MPIEYHGTFVIFYSFCPTYRLTFSSFWTFWPPSVEHVYFLLRSWMVLCILTEGDLRRRRIHWVPCLKMLCTMHDGMSSLALSVAHIISHFLLTSFYWTGLSFTTLLITQTNKEYLAPPNKHSQWAHIRTCKHRHSHSTITSSLLGARHRGRHWTFFCVLSTCFRFLRPFMESSEHVMIVVPPIFYQLDTMMGNHMDSRTDFGPLLNLQWPGAEGAVNVKSATWGMTDEEGFVKHLEGYRILQVCRSSSCKEGGEQSIFI